MDSPAPPLFIKTPSSSLSPDTIHASVPSPTSVIAQATLEIVVSELRAAVSCLCTSENLTKSENSVLKIERLWQEACGAEQAVVTALARPAVINGAEQTMDAALARPAVINGFVEIRQCLP